MTFNKVELVYPPGTGGQFLSYEIVRAIRGQYYADQSFMYNVVTNEYVHTKRHIKDIIYPHHYTDSFSETIAKNVYITCDNYWEEYTSRLARMKVYYYDVQEFYKIKGPIQVPDDFKSVIDYNIIKQRSGMCFDYHNLIVTNTEFDAFWDYICVKPLSDTLDRFKQYHQLNLKFMQKHLDKI
jgi:hypothetical protein